jgi:hypothetical protein
MWAPKGANGIYKQVRAKLEIFPRDRARVALDDPTSKNV